MIRPMRPADKPAVMDLIRATDMFTSPEIDVAEELIDAFLGKPGQKDYDVVIVEEPEGVVSGYMTWGPTPLTVGAYDLYWMAGRAVGPGPRHRQEAGRLAGGPGPRARRAAHPHRDGGPAEISSRPGGSTWAWATKKSRGSPITTSPGTTASSTRSLYAEGA